MATFQMLSQTTTWKWLGELPWGPVDHKHVDLRPAADSHLTSPPTHQKNVHELVMPSLNSYYKTYLPKNWGHMV